MRKLLDWITDKLGYQRKRPYLNPFIYDQDGETLSTLDWPLDYLSIDTRPHGLYFLPFELTGALISDEPDIPPPLMME